MVLNMSSQISKVEQLSKFTKLCGTGLLILLFFVKGKISDHLCSQNPSLDLEIFARFAKQNYKTVLQLT